MSAKVFSVFRKNHKPPEIIKNTKHIDKEKPGMLNSIFFPKIAHLKPSITPTIGFNEYINLHFSGTTELLKSGD